MILKLNSSFHESDRAKIELPKLNLEAEAYKEYPNGAIGTVVCPHYTDLEGNVQRDEQKEIALRDQRLVYLALDRIPIAITVPEWLLKHIKPEDDPMY